MESLEFLGGRYSQPEQIMSGPVQAFRAQNAATGRMVFIHRVSTTEEPAEQAAVLKLLTTALVKSAEAKRLVLDFGEEGGYWYVVTESESKCALLREWLQLEVEASANGARSAPPSDPKPSTSPFEPSTDTGEFTRFLKGRAPLDAPVVPADKAAAAAPPGEFTRIFQSAIPTAAAPDQPAPPAPKPAGPGEFTSFFNSKAAENSPPPPKPFSSGTPQRPLIFQTPGAPPPVQVPPSPAPATPAAPESGEFTRFFKPGLPPTPPKPAVNNPFVQRPNTPVPPPSAPVSKPTEKAGEFTQLFSRPQPPAPAANLQPPSPPRNDPFGFSQPPSQSSPGDLASDNLFSDKIDIPQPLPPSKPQESDFTRMFGTSGAAKPPVPPPAVVATPPTKPLVEENPKADPLRATQQFSLPTSAPAADNAPAANSPSEFTMIMQGGYGPSKPPVDQPATPAAPAGTVAPKASPSAPLAPPPLKAPTAPKIPAPNLKPPSAKLPISVPPAGGPNKKLIILFAVIGVLAILMVLLAYLQMKK